MLAKKRILIVDDEVGIVELLKEKLEPTYQVIKAYDGLEGLEKAMDQPPDLIILDIKMPKLDGFEVLKRLKADTKTRCIPVIMLTGEANTNSILKAQDSRAADYLIKPVVLEAVLPLVRRHI